MVSQRLVASLAAAVMAATAWAAPPSPSPPPLHPPPVVVAPGLDAVPDPPPKGPGPIVGPVRLVSPAHEVEAMGLQNVLPPPSKDPFYAVPTEAVAEAPPGAILRHRTPPNPIAGFGVLPVRLKAAHQILYRTTDSLGNATATVLTVLIPHHADLGKVLSYQVAEDAASIDCAPSYAFQFAHATGPDHGTLLTEAELLLIEAALEQGWVVIAPDFLGPRAAFLANALAGQATLDGIRAAINSGSFTGIEGAPKVAMWGYSGGSLASLWAAELQPSYAPELKIAGAAVGGTVPDIATALTSIDGKRKAGLIPAGILGLANQHADLDELLSKHLRPEYRDHFYSARSQCFEANSLRFRNENVTGMLDDPSLILTDPLARKLIDANRLGRATPRIPLFVYKSMNDEISPISETDALVQKYCAAGTPVEYQRDALSDHTTLSILAAPKALAWLRRTLDGNQRRTGCAKHTVIASLLDPEALKLLPKILIDALLDLLGKQVGPGIG